VVRQPGLIYALHLASRAPGGGHSGDEDLAISAPFIWSQLHDLVTIEVVLTAIPAAFE
jgi:hypothetical protein